MPPWKSEETCKGQFSPSPHVGSKDPTQAVSLCGRLPHPPSHLTHQPGPETFETALPKASGGLGVKAELWERLVSIQGESLEGLESIFRGHLPHRVKTAQHPSG